MHRPRALVSALAVFLLTFLTGCVSSSTPRLVLAEVRAIFVADTVAAPDLKFEGLGHVVHDTAVRELRRKGYTVVSSPSEAQAVMRSTWRPRQAAGLRFDRTDMQLTLSLFDQDGHRLFETDTGPGFSAGFWNEPRTADEVVKALGRLPTAPSVR